MARGSYAAWPLGDVALSSIRDAAVEALEQEGYRVTRRTVGDGRCRVVGMRGSKWLAYLGSMLPFGGLLGIGSRVQATVLARRSLDDAGAGLRLSIRCAPLEEGDSMEEDWYYEAAGESYGDHARCRRSLRRLTASLRASGIL